jgi:hypothetical protein
MAKFTKAKIKEQIKKIQQALEKEKSRYRDQNLTVIEVKPEDFERKLKRMKSPFIIGQAFTGSAPAGGTINLHVGIWNPDPIPVNLLFVHVWVGSGNVDPVVGTFLLKVDTRFPRLTEPKFPGAGLISSSFHLISFALKVPTGVQKTNYPLNACLMKFNFGDVVSRPRRCAF